MNNELITRFISYAQVNTQSDDDNENCPSSPGQMELARKLAEELKEIGMQEVTLDEFGYVMATLPSNSDKDVPVIGFMAHLDTATELTGANVKPKVFEDYDGTDLVLNPEQGIVLSPKEFPELRSYAGHTLITTDGTTLLGADDKAGIAEIMTAMHYLLLHPEVKHGKIRVAFTPDEEIGRGPHRFDVGAFNAKYAYTMDGGAAGELEYETFNAAEAKITIQGKVTHPGYAKGKMVNAMKIAMELNGRLPEEQAPERTEGYEGFYHLIWMDGSVDRTEMRYLIRDFDKENFEARKAFLTGIAADLNAKYGSGRIRLEIKDQYLNMMEKIKSDFVVVDIAMEAMRKLGIEPRIKPIRGGTDGAQLSYMGLPTPNLFAGGMNWHGRYEYVSVDTMLQSVSMIIEIARLFEEKAGR